MNRFLLRSRRAAVALVVVGATALGGCGSDDDATSAGETTTTEASMDMDMGMGNDGEASDAPGTPGDGEPVAAEPITLGDLSIAGAWARTSPMMTSAGAAYFEVTNFGDADDELVSVAVDASVAAMAELHNTTMGEDGMMTMSHVESIPVPAGETVALQPGGYHVMLMELAKPLEKGEGVELTLTFRDAGETVVKAEVRDDAP